MNNPKEHIREEMRRLRSALSPEEKNRLDQQITQQLWDWPPFQEAAVVYLYASLAQEVDTWGLLGQLWKKKVRVALPRVEKKRLRFYFVDNKDALESGFYGIQEPAKGCPLARDAKAVLVTPGLAFSVSGDRVGYGGGYYDRFFEQEPGHLCVALAYPFQVKADITAEKTDHRMQWIITSDKIIECPQGA